MVVDMRIRYIQISCSVLCEPSLALAHVFSLDAVPSCLSNLIYIEIYIALF